MEKFEARSETNVISILDLLNLFLENQFLSYTFLKKQGDLDFHEFSHSCQVPIPSHNNHLTHDYTIIDDVYKTKIDDIVKTFCRSI